MPTIYCHLCESEARGVVQFHQSGEHLIVCGFCEDVVSSVLNRLPSDSYDVTIIPLQDYLADQEEDNDDE